MLLLVQLLLGGWAGDGHVVVGSEDGKVRLYSSTTLTTAKTSIPGLGAPVTAVDVSYDAEWVLATTDKYLMVVKTGFQDKTGRWNLSPALLCSDTTPVNMTRGRDRAGDHLVPYRTVHPRPHCGLHPHAS